MQKINVLYINTFLKGGAFQAARRLHNGLRDLGVESQFLGFSGKAQNTSIHAIPRWQNLLVKAAVKFKMPINRAGKNARLIPPGGNYEVYSFPTSDFDLSKHPLVKQADIIHLHWVNNFLDYPTFFEKVKKPIIWTLHDMNLFQGGFHYEDDQQRNAIAFEELDQKLKLIKQNALANVQSLQIVCPSKWLMTVSKNSSIGSNFDHFHIFNGLDLDIFKPRDRNIIKAAYQLPSNQLLFLFVAEKVGNPRKGFDLLLQAIQSLEGRKDILFCAIGELDAKAKQENILELGYIREEAKLSELYAASDAVILPSREDNLPNVMLEAMACGTPVIGFSIGGVPEVVITGQTGILAQRVTADALKAAILDFADRRIELDRNAIRAFAEMHFDVKTQAGKYLTLYESCLGKLKQRP